MRTRTHTGKHFPTAYARVLAPRQRPKQCPNGHHCPSPDTKGLPNELILKTQDPLFPIGLSVVFFPSFPPVRPNAVCWTVDEPRHNLWPAANNAMHDQIFSQLPGSQRALDVHSAFISFLRDDSLAPGSPLTHFSTSRMPDYDRNSKNTSRMIIRIILSLLKIYFSESLRIEAQNSN